VVALVAGIAVGIGAPARAEVDPTLMTFSLPASIVEVRDITAGPDGNVWFAARQSSGSTIGSITTGGAVTTFDPTVPAYSLATGSDGNLWFASPDQIGRITTGGVTTLFDIPGGCCAQHVALGPDGNVWFTHSEGIGRVTPSGIIDLFPLPGSSTTIPSYLTAGPDGNIWYQRGISIGRIGVDGSGAVEFATPELTFGALTSGPDGNVWFRQDRSVGRITPSGTLLGGYTVPDPSAMGAYVFPIATGLGPDGNVWVTTSGGSDLEAVVARVLPTGEFTQFPVPSALPYGYLLGLTTGPDGNVWFIDSQHPVIGRITWPGATTTTLGLPASPANAESPLTVTATVAAPGLGSTPSGAVQFIIDGAEVGSPVTLAAGQASFTTTFQAGSHKVRARYLGDGAHLASQSFTARFAAGRPTVLSAAPAVAQLSPFALSAFTLSATLRYTDGTLARGFRVDMLDTTGQPLCTATDSSGSGTASCSIATDPLGVSRVVAGFGYVAIFRGDSSRLASQGAGPLIG
jgi:streptogramin lyase